MIQYLEISNDIQLAFKDEGTGTPILCLPGLTRTMGDFDCLMPSLSRCRIIRMDYRGRGNSSWAEPNTYTVAQEAQDVLLLLDHLELNKVAIIGTSRGGLIGMLLANIAPERLNGLLLNDIGPEIDRAGLERIALHIGRNPDAKTYGEMADILNAIMTGFSGVSHKRWEAEARRQYRESNAGIIISYDPSLRDTFLHSLTMDNLNLWPFFQEIRNIPLALVRGKNSDLLQDKTALKMKDMRPDLLFLEISNRGHSPFLDEDEAIKLIHIFIENVVKYTR